MYICIIASVLVVLFMNRKRFLSFGESLRGEYVSPSCEVRSLSGFQVVCVSARTVTVDDFVIEENEFDW